MRLVKTYDEYEFGLSWVLEEAMQRTSHALVDGGRVWLVDPVAVDEALERALALGEPVGVLQLLDRHNRDCAKLAAQLGVPHLRVPDELPGTPFEAIPVVRFPGWRETALWWPDRRALVVAEVLSTLDVFTGGAAAAGMHPLVRLTPPGRLRGLDPEHLLMGHGSGLHGAGTAAAVERAHARARRDIPRMLAKLPAALR
jgi:hypothetical protein